MSGGADRANCKGVEQALAGGRLGAVPESIARHLRECPRCQALWKWMTTQEDTPMPPEAVIGNITRSLGTRLEAVTPLPSTAGLAVRLFVLLVLIALGIGSLIGLGGAAAMTLTQRVASAAAIGVAAAVVAVSLGWQMRPGSLHRFSPAAAVLLALVTLLAAAAAMFPLGVAGISAADGAKCTRSGIAMAVPAALLIWLLVRRGVAIGYEALGATIGGTAGLVSVAALQFHCPHHEMMHFGLWHCGIIAVCALAGWGAGRAFRSSPWNRA